MLPGVEICGALKNVLAIAAGIVEGLDLGHNALAALIAQGCAEIRWLSQKVGAKPATISGLSGLGDIMLTCYGDLSRNRSVGVRLGRGEKLHDILASSTQVRGGRRGRWEALHGWLTRFAAVLCKHISVQLLVFG